MLRGRTRANHRNRFAGIQMPEQRSSPLDKQPSRRGGPPGPNSLARQDHLAEEHSWGPQDRAPTPAHICIDRRRADSATATPALGKDALSASPRADPAQWIGHGRKYADPPFVNSPGRDNNSIATTNPAPARRK
uniref:hypothetical protein n=1 Tax=Synechococcus sp. UW106 TaxID=368495 RepID=UPI00352F1D13